MTTIHIDGTLGGKKPPTEIEGTPVHESGEPMEFEGGLWHTFVPDDYSDFRIWEWDERSGRIIDITD